MSVAAKATGTQDLWHFQEAAEGSVWLKWGLSEEEGRRRAQRERRARRYQDFLDLTWR